MRLHVPDVREREQVGMSDVPAERVSLRDCALVHLPAGLLRERYDALPAVPEQLPDVQRTEVELHPMQLGDSHAEEQPSDLRLVTETIRICRLLDQRGESTALKNNRIPLPTA